MGNRPTHKAYWANRARVWHICVPSIPKKRHQILISLNWYTVCNCLLLNKSLFGPLNIIDYIIHFRPDWMSEDDIESKRYVCYALSYCDLVTEKCEEGCGSGQRVNFMSASRFSTYLDFLFFYGKLGLSDEIKIATKQRRCKFYSWYFQRSGDIIACATRMLQFSSNIQQTWHTYYPRPQEQLLLKMFFWTAFFDFLTKC
jgi:hypothetical protein